MFAIGLDIGTTSICGVLINRCSGEVINTINLPNDTWISGEAWEKKQSAEKIIEKTDEILNSLYIEGVEAIGVTGQMHGIVYHDSHGSPVSPLYIWQDERGNLPFRDKTYAEHLGSCTGYGNVTHFYNKVNEIVPTKAVGFCTIHDMVVMHLTNRKSPLVHVSDAASFGMYDIDNKCFTVYDEMQPEITELTEVAGYWNGIAVGVAIGDNQASFIGGGCDADTVLCNVGTGSQISFVASNVPGLETRPLIEGQTISVGSSLCGGRAYALLEKFFAKILAMCGCGKEDLYADMEKEAERFRDTSLNFETFFCGSRTQPDRRALISGISESNFTPGDMIYACLKGICTELKNLYDKADKKCSRLVGTGNGIRKNKLLKSIFEEEFSLKMEIPSQCEEAAIGAALFALTAYGAFESIEDAEGIIKYEGI